MKNNLIKKILIICITSCLVCSFPFIGASAEWKRNSDNTWSYDNVTNGWFKDRNDWYFFKNGVMQTGWLKDTDGKWYYLSNNGNMLSNSNTPDGYKVDNNGVWIQNTTVNSNNTNTVNNINSNNTTNTNVTNNVNNGIIINGNVNIGNTTNNNTAIQQNNNINNDNDTKSGQVSVPSRDENNTVNSIYPCWTILNGKYYHINKDKEIDYDKTVDGYVIGTDGAWEQESSITPPKAIELPYGYKLQALQVIQKLQHEAKLDDLRKESKEEKHQYRMDKIKELQGKIDNIKKHNYNNGQEMLQKYENEIKALEIQDENDYK